MAENALWQFEWSDAIAVGDPVVDAQHRAFFAEVDQLRAALLSDAPKDSFLRYIAAFDTNLRTHFADEERLMSRIGFPRLREHRMEHGLLLARVAEVRKEVDGAACLLDCMLATRSLMVMLVEHIQNEDLRIKPLLAQAVP